MISCSRFRRRCSFWITHNKCLWKLRERRWEHWELYTFKCITLYNSALFQEFNWPNHSELGVIRNIFSSCRIWVVPIFVKGDDIRIRTKATGHCHGWLWSTQERMGYRSVAALVCCFCSVMVAAVIVLLLGTLFLFVVLKGIAPLMWELTRAATSPMG